MVTSNFTFLTGASHPEEFVEGAASLGHSGAAIADVNTLAGVVRAHVAAKEIGVPLAVGTRLVMSDADSLQVLVYPERREGYANLCRLLTLGKRRAPKGACDLSMRDLFEHADGLLAVALPPREIGDGGAHALRELRGVFDDDRLSLAVSRRHEPGDDGRVRSIVRLGAEAGVPLAAVNDAHYHHPSRRALQDVLTCVRHGCTIDDAGRRLHASAERRLKPPAEMLALLPGFEGALERSADVAERASRFGLDELRYEYPVEPCPPGTTPIRHLRELSWAGGLRRYGGRVPEKAARLLDHELALIEELGYEAYFLTCWDLVAFARSRGILCQGRGGAANSAVCYCLGITEVDPASFQLLFERFISRARGEPPDIDIDFEHERREEVIQYLYGRYGRERAALTAEVVSYRGRSAVRDVGKAMGLSLDRVDAMAKNLDRWFESPSPGRVREAGLDPEDQRVAQVIGLTRRLVGFPRHLSQHVGGFVITRGPLHELVPIENAAMEDRTVIEWDKDDIDAMGMLKVDVLGLGMLTCVRKALVLVGCRPDVSPEREQRVREQRIDGEEMCDGDSVVQGPRGLAEGDGAGACGVRRDTDDARGGTLRADDAEAPSGDLHPLKHRRGLRAAAAPGSAQVPEDRRRLIERALHPVGTGRIHEHACGGSLNMVADRGDEQGSPGPDRQPDTVNHPACSLCSHSLFSASQITLSLLATYRRLAHDLADPLVYDMICRADTLGVFQIESRAQMSMLPRLRPREFYDLVIEVAIVRPGPIQGNMVHPYLRRRSGEEEVSYPSDEVREVLERTLGVPLFQEQAMRLAIVAAGFTPDEADRLRRAMAAWKRKGNQIARFGEQLIDGMIANGYEREFAERCFDQIKGFSEYGFPESHAASFAIIVYVSCWLKRHHPAAFAAALINSQPMGFYAPAQIVRDAKAHGVEVRPIDVNRSEWECGLEGEGAAAWRHGGAEGGESRRDGEPESRSGGGRAPPAAPRAVSSDDPSRWGAGGPAVRLGMRLVKGLREEEADRIAAAVRKHGGFSTIEGLWRASGVSVGALRRLARADAFRSMGLDRRAALWAVKPLRDERLPLFERCEAELDEAPAALPAIRAGRHVLMDYEWTGLSLKAHPVSFVRRQLDEGGVVPCADLRDASLCPQGRRVTVAGVVLVRQRPGTASGVVFITLEDETGVGNLVVWPKVFELHRRVARLSSVLRVTGRIERQGEVVHVHAGRIESLDAWFPTLGPASRDFH